MLRTLVADKERLLQKQLNAHEDKLQNIIPRLSRCELQITGNTERLNKHSTNLDKHKKMIETLDNTKLTLKANETFRKQADAHMKKIDDNNNTLLNQQISQENYIEKYLPLKL